MNQGNEREEDMATLYNATTIYPTESGLVFPDFIDRDGIGYQVKATNGTYQLPLGMETITLIEALQWYSQNVACDIIILCWTGKRRGKEHAFVKPSELIDFASLFRLTWSSSGSRAVQFIGGGNKAGKVLYNRIKKG